MSGAPRQRNNAPAATAVVAMANGIAAAEATLPVTTAIPTNNPAATHQASHPEVGITVDSSSRLTRIRSRLPVLAMTSSHETIGSLRGVMDTHADIPTTTIANDATSARRGAQSPSTATATSAAIRTLTAPDRSDWASAASRSRRDGQCNRRRGELVPPSHEPGENDDERREREER